MFTNLGKLDSNLPLQIEMDTLLSGFPEHTGSARILFVDKDLCMRQMMEMVLKGPFQVVTAPSAEKGLAVLAQEGPFGVVMSSFGLPGLNGLEFLLRVAERYPMTRRILMTGGADSHGFDQAISSGQISCLLFKPYCMKTLQELLKRELAVVGTIGTAD